MDKLSEIQFKKAVNYLDKSFNKDKMGFILPFANLGGYWTPTWFGSSLKMNGRRRKESVAII